MTYSNGYDSDAVRELRAAMNAAGGDRAYWYAQIRAQRLRDARARATHTQDQWLALVDDFESRCVRCGCYPLRIFKDHIVPLYQGGTDGIDNVQPVCGKCNTSKGAESFNWAAYRMEYGYPDVDGNIDEVAF